MREILCEIKTPFIVCTLCRVRVADVNGLPHLLGHVHRYNVLVGRRRRTCTQNSVQSVLAPDSIARVNGADAGFQTGTDDEMRRHAAENERKVVRGSRRTQHVAGCS